MRQTENLGLSLYETNDKMNITGAENSLNHNMELIDAEMGNKSEIILKHDTALYGSDINETTVSVEWEKGHIYESGTNVGQDHAHATLSRSVGYVICKNFVKCVMRVDGGVATFLYDADKNCIGRYPESTGSYSWNTTDLYNNVFSNLPENAVYIRFTTYSSDTTPDIEITYTDDREAGILERVDTIEQNQKGDVIEKYTYKANDGYLNANDTITTTHTNGELYTVDKISLLGLKAIRIDISFTEPKSLWIAMSTYDKNKNIIKRTVLTTSTSNSFEQMITFEDESVKYVRFSFRGYNESRLNIYMITNVNDCVKELLPLKDSVNIIDRFSIPNTQNCLRNLFGGQYFYDHLFIDKINGNNVVIPSESIFNIEISKRLGFRVIEANVLQTSDKKYIVMHGESEKFGSQVEHIGGEDIRDVSVSSVDLAYIKNNVRYKSIYEKYRTSPASLEEYLYECKRMSMIPIVQDVGSSIQIANKIMGSENYICYTYSDDARDRTAAPIMTYSSKTTKDEIIMQCEKYGLPYIYCMGNPTSFDDDTLTDIVRSLHELGYWIASAGCYLSEIENQRLHRLGFDLSAASYSVNDDFYGNLCYISDENTFFGF